MKLPKAYDPNQYERGIYDLWEKSGAFQADPKSNKPNFSISMPPPNETATLHLGSALFLVLQDIIARHERQKGKDVLWLPGTDHAAIATNALVEKQLEEQGTNKNDLGREAFVQKVKEFVSGNRQAIVSQMRAMGASADWSRLRYTLDDALNRTVNEVFVRMYKDGLIYRGHRIVNWDPKLQTTVSDDEVVHREVKTPFYTFQYGPFQIGTSRPETKFGDKYVVMHPDDKRYAQYKSGETFETEWINGPVTATIIKDEAVDPSFGTGVMTITPWHDHTDFEIAERHGLEKEQIIDSQGRLTPIAGELAGLSIEEARSKVVAKLKAKGLVVNVDESYVHSIALNERGQGVIEPQIKLQWFVDVNRPAVSWKGQLLSLKEVMRAVIEDEDIKLIPKRFEKIYYHWIDNLRDWCISRQIWWGHQIPVWYKGGGDQPEIYVGLKPPEGKGWKQDPDTLDTWFSSALWTWSTLIDPELAKDYSLSLEDLLDGSLDFKTYHPTDFMETGWDILFFWVARMILATTYTISATGQPQNKRIPFKTVYLHGLIRTEAGKKMSKSEPETSIDPMEVSRQYGTDALRLALVSGVFAGNDLRVGKSRIVDGRNFANKLWNIARYIEGIEGQNNQPPLPKTLTDHWILDRLQTTAELVKKYLEVPLPKETSEGYEGPYFSEAYMSLYHFVWGDLADWYIEASKSELNPDLLSYVLEATLVLVHPFAPFITEAIWQNSHKGSLLATQPWPQLIKYDSGQSTKFELTVKMIVGEVRWWRATLGTVVDRLYFQDSQVIRDQSTLIAKLSGLSEVNQSPDSPPRGLRLTSIQDKVWLDVDPKLARNKLIDKQKAYQESIKALSGRLANKDYLQKAPGELVAETNKQLAESQMSLNHLEKVLGGLEF